MEPMQKRNCGTAVDFILRIGLVIAFLYASIAQMLHPEAWIMWFPPWLGNIADLTILLYVFSIYELALGLWLLCDKKTFYAAVLAAITMFLIVISNLPALDLVFRDIPILFTALALAVLHYHRRENNRHTETIKRR